LRGVGPDANNDGKGLLRLSRPNSLTIVPLAVPSGSTNCSPQPFMDSADGSATGVDGLHPAVVENKAARGATTSNDLPATATHDGGTYISTDHLVAAAEDRADREPPGGDDLSPRLRLKAPVQPSDDSISDDRRLILIASSWVGGHINRAPPRSRLGALCGGNEHASARRLRSISMTSNNVSSDARQVPDANAAADLVRPVPNVRTRPKTSHNPAKDAADEQQPERGQHDNGKRLFQAGPNVGHLPYFSRCEIGVLWRACLPMGYRLMPQCEAWTVETPA
jgi:hypothetical protein